MNTEYLYTVIVQPIIRHGLTTVGGAIVGNGVITASQEQDAIGAIIVLCGIGWSIIQKHINFGA